MVGGGSVWMTETERTIAVHNGAQSFSNLIISRSASEKYILCIYRLSFAWCLGQIDLFYILLKEKNIHKLMWSTSKLRGLLLRSVKNLLRKKRTKKRSLNTRARCSGQFDPDMGKYTQKHACKDTHIHTHREQIQKQINNYWFQCVCCSIAVDKKRSTRLNW